MTATTPIDPLADQVVAADVYRLWSFHQLDCKLDTVDLIVGLGSSDFDVPDEVARLYNEGYSRQVVFTGASRPTTKERYPRGEAVEFGDRAVSLGVPRGRIYLETQAVNTGENFKFTRKLVDDHHLNVSSIIAVCMPYMQRRAYATACKVWPEVAVTCSSKKIGLKEYIAKIANPKKVIDDLVGDTQKVIRYPELGFTISQEVPFEILASLNRLIQAGFTSRLIKD